MRQARRIAGGCAVALLLAALPDRALAAAGDTATAPEGARDGAWSIERSDGEVRYVVEAPGARSLLVRCPLGEGPDAAAIEVRVDGRAIDTDAARLGFDGSPGNPDNMSFVNPARPGPMTLTRRRVILRFLLEYDRVQIWADGGETASFETAGPADNFAPCLR